MNDDISLIGHMSGQGEAAADKLRQAGYTTSQEIIEEKPSVLAESTGLAPGIISKIINSAKSLGGVRPVTRTKAKVKKNTKKKVTKKAAVPPKKKAKAKRKAVKAVPSRKKVKKREVMVKKTAKKVKKPAAKPKETIAETPIFDPLRRVAHSFAAEHEIAEGTAIKFVDAVKKNPSIRGKILKEVMARDKFRKRLACHLVRELT